MTQRVTHEVALVAVKLAEGVDGYARGAFLTHLRALVATGLAEGVDGFARGALLTQIRALVATGLAEGVDGFSRGIYLSQMRAIIGRNVGPVMDWIPMFLEIRFPTDISAGSQGAPRFNVESVEVDSGHRQTLSRWAMELQRFNVAYGVTSMEKLETLHAFFRVVGGRENFFRYKDHLDFTSSTFDGVAVQAISMNDQVFGTMDSIPTTTYQLIKTYTYGASTYVRNIVKPVAGTVTVAFDGVLAPEGVDWSIDNTTGIITLIGSPLPIAGVSLTAGYEFDVPAQFMVNTLPTTLGTYGVGTSVNIGVEEVRIT